MRKLDKEELINFIDWLYKDEWHLLPANTSEQLANDYLEMINEEESKNK